MMYDELIYHLDLCILAYHFYSQTLIWPTDPYYEQQLYHQALGLKSDPLKGDRRKAFMVEVRGEFDAPSLDGNGQAIFHGPGSCGGTQVQGWYTNRFLDPIITKYSRINPWRPSFDRGCRHRDPWALYYNPPITDRIDSVYMTQYDGQTGPTGQPIITTLFPNRPPGTYGAPPTDRLYAFEGGTGAIAGARDARQYASWSVMGFVLARKVSRDEIHARQGTPEPYDVHIVFRGSRSGRVGLRPVEALRKQKGNPDWVTDMDFNTVVTDNKVSEYGSVCRGFATSIKSILPTIMASLVDIHSNFHNPPAPPRTIYVTGHSLGGALACHFASAMIMGRDYSPGGTGASMPNELRTWPWRGMQVMTFSAPVVGGDDFHKAFNNSMASRRIWREGDPVTQERRHYPVGIPYRIPLLLAGLPGRRGHRQEVIPMSHHPRLIREDLLAHRNKHEFPIRDVPTEEPWQDFGTCALMLEQLRALAQKGGFNILECFPEFVDHLQVYLEILKRALAPNAATQPVRDGLDQCIVAARRFTPTMVKGHWDSLAREFTTFDSDLYRYLGLCLALALVSRGQGWTEFRDLLNTI